MDTTTKAPVSYDPIPFDKITDRPVDPVKNVASHGGAVMIDGVIYKGGTAANASYSPDKIVSGSDTVRQEQNAMEGILGGINNDILNTQTETTMEDLKKLLGYKEPGTFTSEDEAYIERAGERERLKWEPLIGEAEEAKRRGMPKAIIGAGERGGFMSTQFAGAAALAPTVGEDFVGTGGVLDQVKSDYDKNIADLKAKQLQAIELAKENAREALKGEKSEAYNRAVELYKLAQSANAQAVALAQDKVNLINSYEKLKEARVTYNMDKMRDIVNVGGNIPADMKAELDELYGEGWTDLYIQAVQGAKASEGLENEISTMKNILDLLKSYPAGKELQIGGYTYETVGSSADTQTFKEDDGKNYTYVTVNKRTGEIVSTALGGKVAPKATGGGGSGTATPKSIITEDGGTYTVTDPKFWTEVNKSRDELQQGEHWGSVFDRFKGQFPEVRNDFIDTVLGAKQWREEGAYQKWVEGKQISKSGAKTDEEKLYDVFPGD